MGRVVRTRPFEDPRETEQEVTDTPCTHAELSETGEDTDFRIFSGEYHPTTVPQWGWICGKCLVTGDETAENSPLFPMPKLYWKLMLKKDPTTNVPAPFPLEDRKH